MTDPDRTIRCFTSYSGARLPLKLVGELATDELRNRNTYYRGEFEAGERLMRCEKVVYGEIEVSHEYLYHPDGRLAKAVIHGAGDEPESIDYPT